MAMLRICSMEGCKTKTLGDLCMQHEPVRTPAPRRHTTLIVRAAA